LRQHGIPAGRQRHCLPLLSVRCSLRLRRNAQATLTKRPECQALPPRAERHRGSVLPLGAPFVLGEATARTSGAAAVQSTRRSTVVVDRAHSSEQSHVFPDRPLPLRDIPRPPTPSPPKESDPVEPR
jgi:hypothetical protein